MTTPDKPASPPAQERPVETGDARTKFFIDTEFIESGPSFPLILLSIGIVDGEGRELYLVNADAPLELANDWVRKNVIPHLGPSSTPIKDFPSRIKEFIGDCKPEFWGYYADYDWVVFCQIFGAMIDLPKGWPKYCRDLKQLCDSLGNPELSEQVSAEHNALNDAQWNKQAYEFLRRHAPHAAPQAQVDSPTGLLPCPFCGGKAYYTESVNGSRMVYAGCSECGIAQKAEKVYQPGGDYLTKDVKAAWNRRFEVRRDKLLETVQWIASQTDLFFAECSQAEEIVARCKEALGQSVAPHAAQLSMRVEETARFKRNKR